MSTQYPIKVTLEVYKKLTSMMEEGQSYDDVIRDLLSMDSLIELERPGFIGVEVGDAFQRSLHGRGSGFISRGLWLPNGTELRARYKQSEYKAKITNDEWVAEDKKTYSSPSAAASAITGTNVNGLRFWQARRPTDTGWRRLEVLVGS